MTRVKSDIGNPAPAPRLSARQRDCLRGVLQLKSAKEIARDLGISQHAVEKHLKVCREKYGVFTTAEAARTYSLQEQGGETPQCGSSDLPPCPGPADKDRVSEGRRGFPVGSLEDTNGALLLEQPLTPRQTLLTIAALSFGSIVGLLLLVACAEAIRSLVSR